MGGLTLSLHCCLHTHKSLQVPSALEARLSLLKMPSPNYPNPEQEGLVQL